MILNKNELTKLPRLNKHHQKTTTNFGNNKQLAAAVALTPSNLARPTLFTSRNSKAITPRDTKITFSFQERKHDHSPESSTYYYLNSVVLEKRAKTNEMLQCKGKSLLNSQTPNPGRNNKHPEIKDLNQNWKINVDVDSVLNNIHRKYELKLVY